MSGQQISDNLHTLFSFELLVEYIRIENCTKVSDELALAVRLLDFPTLLIYQPQHSSGSNKQPDQDERDKRREYAFNRGKSCFFKMNLDSLHIQLSNTPLYAMVLDVKEETPRLIGSSLISLAKAMGRIRQDLTERGVSSPSSHRETGLVGVCNLTGEKIGSISLRYKLLCLGTSLLPHITERGDLKSTSGPGGQHVQEHVKEKNKSTESLPLDCGNVCSPTLDKAYFSGGMQDDRLFLNEDEQDDDAVCVAAEQGTTSQTENNLEEDLSVFCPPHLYYSNSAEERSRTEEGDYKLLNLDSEAFTFEDSCSEDAENKVENPSSPVTHHRGSHDPKMSSKQETSGVTPNVLGEAIRQLPLLNTLLAELSQLNGQNPNQSLTVHPSLAWIYRPASTEPSAGPGNTPRKAQTKSLQKTRQGTSPCLKHLHHPRLSSTPIIRPASVKAKDKPGDALIESKSSRKKLVYGTTKTFDLRLKQISPLKVKQRECMQLIQNETQSSMAKGKPKSSNKTIKSSKRKSVLSQSFNLNDNIETVIQSVTEECVLQETVTLKQKNQHGIVHDRQDGNGQRTSDKPSHPERALKCIHIPSVDSDSVPQSKDKKEHHSKSDQSQSESDRNRDKIESSGSSGHSSPKSSFSGSSRKGNEEVDYADDFNSLEHSDAYSPDPVSSPEPSRAKTQTSLFHPDFCNSDSGPEGVQKRAALLPVPVKASRSPQRALRGTHIIQPRNHTSDLSFSSDDGDRNGSSSIQTACSRKQMTARVEWSSGGESFMSTRGQRSESAMNSGHVRGFSAESVSSFEPQEAEELEDELGSLDFRKEYQHISQLVASKLPGYTM